MTDARVVIVTGGTYGIGHAIGTVLAERGHNVVAFGLDAPQPASAAAEGSKLLLADATARGLALDVLEADVSKAAEVRRVVDFTLKKFGRVDALVNNAALGPLGSILDTSEELWDRVIDVNLKGPFLCCKAVLPHMLAERRGSIVNIGSGAGWGKPNMFAYSASKGGIFAFSQALAYDFYHHGIRVNTVVPGGGGIDTGMTELRRGFSAVPKASPVTTARPRATTEDIARAVAFLLSPDARSISGTIIDVGCFASQGGPIPSP